jgi:hypothetical protein
MAPIVRRVAALGLAGLAAVGALKLATLGLARLDCLWLAPLLAALAWPLWAYRSEQALFVRRLVLAGATTPSARLRRWRWLWRGTATQSFGVVTALLWAGLLLLAAAQLTALQWVILAADALLLAALSPVLRRLLRHEIAPEFVDTVARRWPVLLCNTLLLTLAFVAHDYQAGFADTRTLSWTEVVSWALQSRQASAACPTAAALLGVSALADQLPRHAAMLYLPGVADVNLKLLAWVVLLAVTGFGAYLFTRCLLGVQALLDGWVPQVAAGSGGPLPGRIFIGTSLATLALVGLLAALGLRLDASVLGTGAVQLARLTNPCARVPDQALALRAQAQGQLDAATRQAVDTAMRTVDGGLNQAFAAAEAGIDAYLDWYFSLVGSYARLGAVVVSGLDQHMSKQFMTLVFDHSGFTQEVSGVGVEADSQVLDRIAQAAHSAGQGFARDLKLQPCLIETLRPHALLGLQRDKLRAAMSAAIALPLSRSVPQVAVRAGEAVMARAAARQTMRAAASAVGAKATQRGVSVMLSAGAAGALCAPGGPLALACATLAGVAAWLGVDVALLAVDEALFRKSLRADLLEDLQAERLRLREALRLQLEQAAADYSLQAGRQIELVFVPARDG